MQRRWVTAVEIATAFAAAAGFTFFCRDIGVDPMLRMGQVSGMATIAMRFLLVLVPVIGALVVAMRFRGGASFETVSRFVCAALAGLASAAFAAGVLLALRGTPFGIGGSSGDAGALTMWADDLKRGQTTFSAYPPLQVYLLKWISELVDIPTAHAMKLFQTLGVALFGPAAYAAWRLLMRPGWALALAVVSMLPLIEPYRPYAGLVLVVLVPVLLKFLHVLRDVGTLSLQRVMQSAALFGVGLGGLCLLYSGWYQWSAPGFVVAALIVFPWRDWRRGLLFCGIAGVAFVACVLKYVMGFRAGSGIKDSYVYVDALMEPTFFTDWRGGTPGDYHWQQLGELGGVGLFTLLLLAGLAISLTLGRRHTTVIALVSLVAGCWLLRLWYAHNMFATKLVQLWPRTSPEILCCMLLLCVMAVYLLVERVETTSIWRSPGATVGVAVSLMLLSMSASSSTTDQYVPRNVDRTTGGLTWMAQRLARKNPNIATHATVTASSMQVNGFGPNALNDRNMVTFFSSALGKAENHDEWIELRFDHVVKFSHVILYPAADGFPLDFEISVWDGSKWLLRRKLEWMPHPYGGMVVEMFTDGEGGTDWTTGFRIRATRLRTVSGSNDHVLRFSEIELRE